VPVSGGAPALPPPLTPPGARKLRNRRGRLIAAMVAGIVALLCLGGVGVFVSIYDEATEIKRSEPDAVVDSFLGAYFVSRDQKEASLYTCKSGADLGQLEAFRADLEGREQRYSIGIQVTWRNFEIKSQASKSDVAVDLVRTISDGSEETSDRWQLHLVDDGGWRVCGATPVN
jgi:hypothetical protein